MADLPHGPDPSLFALQMKERLMYVAKMRLARETADALNRCMTMHRMEGADWDEVRKFVDLDLWQDLDDDYLEHSISLDELLEDPASPISGGKSLTFAQYEDEEDAAEVAAVARVKWAVLHDVDGCEVWSPLMQRAVASCPF